MPTVVPITSIEDSRIAAYTRMKERDLAREGRRFIAEGELVVRRLIESPFEVESLLLARRRVEEMAPLAPAGAPVYVAEHELVNRIVGFKFHSGVMAVGRRGARRTLAEVAGGWGDRPLTLVVCPEISNTDNLGSLIRIAGGFGADAMIVGEQCCNPFYRQSVRVSMGAVFRLPIIESENLLEDLRRLREEHGVTLAATVLAEDAQPLASYRRPARIAVLFGNEAQGLSAEHVAACDVRLTVPMSAGADSLNVSVSAGIFLYQLTQQSFDS